MEYIKYVFIITTIIFNLDSFIFTKVVVIYYFRHSVMIIILTCLYIFKNIPWKEFSYFLAITLDETEAMHICNMSHLISHFSLDKWIFHAKVQN